jgi:flagellin FlaB
MKHMHPKNIREILKSRRGIVGLEAAIVLIAFVIISAAFSFMVVNQGLFATERGKTVIQEGLKQASTPLTMDGSTLVKTSADGQNVTEVVIPVRAFGVKYVAMWKNETVVTLKVGAKAWANIYVGVSTSDPTNSTLDDLVNASSLTNTGSMLFIENSNGDESLDSFEKGYLLIHLANADAAAVRAAIIIEVRLEKTSPLSIEFAIPESMPKGTWVVV